MANTYYLVTADKIDQVKALAPMEGLPNQLLQIRCNNNNTKIIVQADWVDDASIAALGTYIGYLHPDGIASQGVCDELAKPEWQSVD